MNYSNKFIDKYELISVTLDINDFCNMKCDYCWEQQCSNRLSIENAEIICNRLIENYERHKKASALRIHFFGGEPLIDWDVIKFIMEKMSSKIPSWFGLTTNATLLSDEVLDLAKKYRLHIMVSIDGKKERHDAHRKFIDGRPTYDIVVKNIKKIQERRLDYEARMTILPENAKHVAEDVTHLVKDLGIKQIAPVPVYDVEWTKEQLKDFGDSMVNLYDLYVKYHFDCKNKVYIKFFEDYLYKDMDVKHFNPPCAFGSTTAIAIDTVGNVYPCHQAPTRKDREKFITANIIKDEVYGNNLVTKVLPYTFTSDGCSTCPAKNTICSGGCPMESYEEHGDLLHPTCSTCGFISLYYDVIKRLQKERKIPKPVSPSERRDFLHSVIIRMLNNIRDTIKDNKEYDDGTIVKLSQAMWMINEQILNNEAIHLGTKELTDEIKSVANLIRAEVLKDG